MNNHLSPKAPKPLLWPQTPLGASLPLLRLPCRSFGRPAAPSVGEPIFLHSHSSLATPLVAYSGARSARKASSRAPNRLICSRGPHPASSRAPNRQICSRDPHPASIPCAKPPDLLPRPSSGLLPCAKPPYLLPRPSSGLLPCAKPPDLLPRPSSSPLPCAKPPDLLPRPPPSIPEPVDESILSTYKFVIKPDVIRIAILLTEVGEGIFTARSRVARFAVSLNE